MEVVVRSHLKYSNTRRTFFKFSIITPRYILFSCLGTYGFRFLSNQHKLTLYYKKTSFVISRQLNNLWCGNNGIKKNNCECGRSRLPYQMYDQIYNLFLKIPSSNSLNQTFTFFDCIYSWTACLDSI